METSKIKKLIDVKGYLREGGSVKGYRRYDEVKLPGEQKAVKQLKFNNADELSLIAKNQHERAVEGSNKTLTKDGREVEFQFGDADVHNAMTTIFRNGEHATQDAAIEKSPMFLNNVYDLASRTFTHLEDELTPRSALATLTSPEYLKSVSNTNQRLEKFFNNELDIKTQRVGAFTFKVRLNLSENPSTDYVLNTMWGSQASNPEILWFYDKNGASEVSTSSNKRILGERAARETIVGIDNLVRGTSISEKKIMNTIAPAYIATKMLSPNLLNDRSKIKYISNDLHKAMLKSLPEEMRNFDAMIGDPENIRKGMLQYLTGPQEFQKNVEHGEMGIPEVFHESKKDLIDLFRNIKADEIVSNFMYVMQNGAIFDGLRDGSTKKNISNFSQKLTSKIMEHYNARHDYAYISNNPLEMLTMSPQGLLTSCQSISDNGGIGINEHNINIVNSVNLHKSNDFVMFTKDLKNKNAKRERISLHFNEGNRNFENFEYNAIYTSDEDLPTLKEYLMGLKREKMTIGRNNFTNEFDGRTKIAFEHDTGNMMEEAKNMKLMSQKLVQDLEMELTDPPKFGSEKELEDFIDQKKYDQNEEINQDYLQEGFANYISGSFNDRMDEAAMETLNQNIETGNSLLYGSTADSANLFVTSNFYGNHMKEQMRDAYSENFDDHMKEMSYAERDYEDFLSRFNSMEKQRLYQIQKDKWDEQDKERYKDIGEKFHSYMKEHDHKID